MKAPAQRELSGAPPFHIEVAIVLGVVAAGLFIYWGMPRLLDALGAQQRQTVHARALGECRIPTEYESLYVVINVRANRLVSECMYVGSQGTYTNRRR